MGARRLPAKDQLNICFAHVAYRMGKRFAQRNTGPDGGEWRNEQVLPQSGTPWCVTPHPFLQDIRRRRIP